MNDSDEVRYELNAINTEAGQEIVRVNRAWRDQKEISLAAKSASNVTKRDAALSALHPAYHLGEGIAKAAHATKDQVINAVPASWRKSLRMHFDSLPAVPKEVTHVIMFTTLSSIMLYCQCLGNGQSAHEAGKAVLSTAPAMAGFGAFVAGAQKFIGVPLVKNIIQGLMAEADAVQISLLGASVASFFVGVTWDFCGNCMQLKRDGKWWDFGGRLLRSFASNAVKGALYGAVAFFCPVPVTVAVCVFGAFADNDMRQKYEDLKQPYYVSFAKFVWGTVTFVPRSMIDIFTANEDKAELEDCRDEMLDKHCPSLVCSVTYERLKDPVYLNGAVVSRYVAERRVNQDGVDFYNDCEVTLEDIKPLPELARLLRKADRVLKKVRAGDMKKSEKEEVTFIDF